MQISIAITTFIIIIQEITHIMQSFSFLLVLCLIAVCFSLIDAANISDVTVRPERQNLARTNYTKEDIVTHIMPMLMLLLRLAMIVMQLRIIIF